MDAAAIAALETALQATVKTALKQQRRTVVHREYKTSEDFSEWLRSYRARCSDTHGFKKANEKELQAEILLSISGKLSSGAALNTYDRLTDNKKESYDLLVQRLTEEFSDPQAKRRFNAKLDFNTRKKGQSIKEFVEDIKRDVGRYSTLTSHVTSAVRGVVENPDRENDGVRRFIEGMRDKNGDIDLDFKRHLEYHLQEQTELKWANAIKVASRYETVYEAPVAATESNSEATEVDNDDESCGEVKAIESTTGKKTVLASLADKVHENQMRLTKVETAQERMSKAQEQTAGSLVQIHTKLDLALGQQQYNPYLQQQQLQQQQLLQPAQQRQRTQFQPRGAAGFQARPANATWLGRLAQHRQGNYGYQRRTPANYPQRAVAPAAAPAPAAAAAPVAVAQGAAQAAMEAYDANDVTTEELGATAYVEGEIPVPVSDLMTLINRAGFDQPEDYAAAAIDDLNFF